MCLVQNQYTFNVFHFRVSAVAAPGVTESDVLTQLDALVAPNYKAILPTNCSYYGAKMQVIRPVRLDPFYTAASRGAGTLAGDCLPPQIAGVVNLKTGIASRATRGRFYLPATSEADNDATAKPSAAYVTLMDAFANDLFTVGNITVGGFTLTLTWVVYSRSLQSGTQVLNYTSRTFWGTQRSRSMIKHADAAPF